MTDAAPESVDLLGAVAYGELSAFTRLAADAERAPDLAGRAELARLAAVEMTHHGLVRDHLAARGVDVLAAMAPFVAPLDAFHRVVAPQDWAESLVTAHLGRGLVDDLQGEVVAGLAASGAGPGGGVDPEVVALLQEVLADPGHGAFVERAVTQACADPRVHDRLALAGRRMLGEALAAASTMLDEHPRMAVLLVGTGTVEGRTAVVKRMKSRHRGRMAALNLS